MSTWYCATVPTLEFDYLYMYITLTFFSDLSPSHFILAPWQSCVTSTVVLINEYDLKYPYRLAFSDVPSLVCCTAAPLTSTTPRLPPIGRRSTVSDTATKPAMTARMTTDAVQAVSAVATTSTTDMYQYMFYIVSPKTSAFLFF